MSGVEVAKEELKEIDICDICSKEEESGVFLNSGASYLDGFSAFHKWASKGRSVSDGYCKCAKTASVSLCKCAKVPHGAAAGEIRMERGGGGGGDVYSDEEDLRASRASSIVDCLLVELYDTYSNVRGVDSSTEASSSEAFLGRSNTGSNFLQELQEKHTRRHQMKYLAQKGPEELKWIIQEVKYRIGVQSAKLVRQVKRKDRLRQKFQKNCDIVTACLQAISQKRRVDTRLKFTIEPSLGKNGFQQWYDALKAVARLPVGIPKEWRKRVYVFVSRLIQDLHRTGCSSYCGQEAEQDRVVLKRVLLAYARWNKTVGYCQGFNVLAALILEVTEGNEGDALKVMIYLIDKVLPDSYFANNLRALSVDMAVFRDLLRLKLPELSQHLHHLQKVANREGGGSYEPPLTNVFTMQWFLTMFATCLPHHTVLKIWDSVFFEGSEMLLRVALAIWAKLGERIEECQTADEFYSTMGCLTQEMLEHNLIDSNDLMQTVYSMAPFPFPQLAELREKYTYNITPFPTPVRANSSLALHGWESDDDDADMDDEDSIVTALGCLGPLGGLLAPEIQRYQKHLKDQRAEQSSHGSNMAEMSPGAVGAGRAEHQAAINSMMLERMSTDISALKKQYSRIKQKQQQQAGLLYIHTGPRVEAETIEPHQASKQKKHHTGTDFCGSTMGIDKCPATSILPSQISSSPVVNHLLLGRRPRPGQQSSKNGIVHNGEGPQAHSTPSQDQMIRARHHSPWRTHVRAHRRNIARARAQLGFDDSLEIEDEQMSKTEEASEEGRREDEEQEKVETVSPDVSQQDHSSGEENLQEINKQLSSLELEPELSSEAASDPTPQSDADSDAPTSSPEPASDAPTSSPEPASDAPTSSPEPASDVPTPTPPPESASNPNTPTPPPESQPEPKSTASAPFPSTHRPGSDSFSSESRGSLKSSPSTSAGEPPKPQQIFSPFPCIKTPRKSITARNLGLYGPNARTPNVHFPQMSRSMNHVGNTTRRR
ncbi:TBC1 domain family member 30 [Sinocyclocheilus rhinocerous]|uniref:TBC1 domain family member 30 n=1 Tax=Sinocyclocheilus rhinocerous TaxID=307959 RepID=UPI0007B8217A|nr:PREDICTED: TBC1 domain family member 30-like [Sinocyclocheilus rhinocerous]